MAAKACWAWVMGHVASVSPKRNADAVASTTKVRSIVVVVMMMVEE